MNWTSFFLFTFMRFIAEWTRQTGLQVKRCLFLGSRCCQCAVVASENEHTFWNWKENFMNIYFKMFLSINSTRCSKFLVPGVFVTDVLTLVDFTTAVGCWGVLEATQGEKRAGVFTKEVLWSFSRVPFENLHTSIMEKTLFSRQKK